MQLFLWSETSKAREFTKSERYENSFWIPRSITDYIQIRPRRPGETFSECEVTLPDWKIEELERKNLI